MEISQREITKIANDFCRSKGISYSDLTNHPNLDDVMILIRIRDSYWDVLTSEERGIWGAYWGFAYVKSFRLKDKHITKIERIVKYGEYRKNQKEQARNKIRKLRHDS